MKLLITGGAGFIGSNFIHYILKKYSDYQIVNLDVLTYCGNLENLKKIENNPNYKFVKGDICDVKLVDELVKDCDAVVHFAAESIPGNIYVPIHSSLGTKMITFSELWQQQLIKHKSEKTRGGEVIYLKGKQTKALSFLNGGQWMSIKAITRHWYEGKIIKLKQKWGIIEATPNHSIYSANLDLVVSKSNPELLVVRETNEIRKKYKKVSKGILKVLAAYITEGNATFNKANGGYIIEITQGDKEWLTDIGNLIKKEFDLNFFIITHKKKFYKNVYGLQVSNKNFFNYLVKNCGKYCDGKYFPNWIFDINPKQREFFWQKLLEGDGTKDGRYSTTSYKLINQIGLLLALQKRRFKVFEYDRKNYKRSWEIKTELSGQHIGLNSRKKIEINYKGWVYDLEVDKTHNFVCGVGNVVCHNTHVDRSILDSAPFIKTNILGTVNLLDIARKYSKRFHYISTDEVFGSLGATGYFSEKSLYDPHSPYSASKASADHLVRAYFHTYGVPITITNCSNNYGPYQFPEKLIPLFVTNLLEGKKVPVYGDGLNVRDWLYVEDHCEVVDLVLHKGKIGETYCVGGNEERTNLEITHKILELLDFGEEKIKYVTDRKAHDKRYAIDASKIKKELGWQPQHTFEEAMQKTVEWYKENQEWWKRIKTGEYLDYYKKQYK